MWRNRGGFWTSTALATTKPNAGFAAQRVSFDAAIEANVRQSGSTYGSRRLVADLCSQGYNVV